MTWGFEGVKGKVSVKLFGSQAQVVKVKVKGLNEVFDLLESNREKWKSLGVFVFSLSGVWPGPESSRAQLGTSGPEKTIVMGLDIVPQISQSGPDYHGQHPILRRKAPGHGFVLTLHRFAARGASSWRETSKRRWRQLWGALPP